MRTIRSAGRLKKIDYPGIGNKSEFQFDGLGHNTRIEEFNSGSLSNTKQFVWNQQFGSFRRSEERDVNAVVTKQFHDGGQKNGSSNYFYTRDHLGSFVQSSKASFSRESKGLRLPALNTVGSIRELTDNSGTIQAQYSYDPYGRAAKISETVSADFLFAGYYNHSSSALYLAEYRAYNSALAKWTSRDPIASEKNDYEYCKNNPTSLTDPTGLRGGDFGDEDFRNCLFWFGWPAFAWIGACNVVCGGNVTCFFMCSSIVIPYLALVYILCSTLYPPPPSCRGRDEEDDGASLA